MKIAFISANQEKMPDPVVPLGLLSVMGNVAPHHEKALWDLCFEDHLEEFLVAKIKEFRPDLVAIGIRNIQNNDYSDYRTDLLKYKALVEFLRAQTTAPVIMGGSGFSVMPKEIMTFIKPDFGIHGEGERTFSQFLKCIEAGSGFAEIPGFLYWKDGELQENAARGSFLSINELKPPAREYADPRYFKFTGIANIQSKRGCVLKCTYCTYPKIEGAAKRTKDPVAFVDEMFEAIGVQPDTSHFFVVDSVFNHPKEHAKQICRELISRNWKTPWTCYINPMGFDEDLADLMAQAKCVGYEVGSDSGCDDVLDMLKKGFTTKDIRKLRAISNQYGIKDCHTFILGTPGENIEHVQRSLDFIKDLDPSAAILMAWVDDYEALAPELSRERQGFRNEILKLLRKNQALFQKWVIPPLSYNFDERLFRVLRKKHLAGPLWQHL